MASVLTQQQVWLRFLFFSTLYNYPVLASTETASAQLTTFSNFPAESIGRLAASTVTTETHTVVTSNSKTTTIPILPDHDHGCYFCPTDVGGLILSGFTAPGVYPAHSPSGFPSGFPEITVDREGNPAFQSATSPATLSSQRSSQVSHTSSKATGSANATEVKSSVSSLESSSSSASIKSTRTDTIKANTSTESTDLSTATGTTGSEIGSKSTSLSTGTKSPGSGTGAKSSSAGVKTSSTETDAGTHSTRKGTGSTRATETGSSMGTTASQVGTTSASNPRSEAPLSIGSNTTLLSASSSETTTASNFGSSTFSKANSSTGAKSSTAEIDTTSAKTVIPGSGVMLTTLTAPETTTFTETLTGRGTVQGSSSSFSFVATVRTTYSSGQVLTESISSNSKTTESQSSSSATSSHSFTRSINSTSTSTQDTNTRPTDTRPTDTRTTDTKTTDTKTMATPPAQSSSSTLTTFTVFPTASVGTASSTLTKGGKTTESDSSGHTTVLPVLPNFGSDNGLCWFCPHSGGGFVLSGFPKPGIYPTGNLPGFPTPVPQITIGPDLTPTFSEEPPKSDQPTQSDKSTSSGKTSSTTTTSDCTKSTASSCLIVTSFSEDANGKTTATTTVTSCVTQTGCSVQGTTSASATTTTASGCWQYAYSNDDDSISGDDNKRKRAQVNEYGHRTIQRRAAAETASTFGTCQFNPKVTTPAYPDAAHLEAAKGASYWYVPTTAVLNNQKCPVVTMTQFANTQELTANPVIRDASGKGVIYNIGGTKNPSVNVDHVYELSLFKGFMESVVNSGKFTCQDFESFFLATDPNTKSSRLQVLLDQLPGNTFPDFAGMDAVINVRKGNMFNTKLAGLPKAGTKDYDKRLQVANEMGAAIAFVNSPDIAKLFKSTNSRIYDAFLGIDDLIAKGCGTVVTPDGAGGKWADAYSKYMTDLFSDRNLQITRSIRSYLKSGAQDPATFTDGTAAFKAQYPEANWAWDAGALLDWSAKNPINIGKRDDAVCSKSTAQTMSTSVPASTTKSASNPPTDTGSVTTTRSTQTPATTTTTSSNPNSTSTKPTSTSQKPTTDSSTPTSTSSSATTSINTSTPSCAPSAGAGIVQGQTQADINSFCSLLKDFGGCQTDDGDVIITNLEAACAGGSPYLQNVYYDAGDTLHLNISLAQGSSFRITQNACTTALGTVLNGCAPFSPGSDGIFRKYGGSIGVVENDAAALFQVIRTDPIAIS